jgi:hypothetical protein
MEPLFLCTYTGDPRAAPGNRFRRASMRAAINPYSGYGTAPAYRMLLEPDTRTKKRATSASFELAWFASEADLLAVRSPNMTRDLAWPLLVRAGGKLIPYETCIDMDRGAAYLTSPEQMSRMLLDRGALEWEADVEEYTGDTGDTHTDTHTHTHTTGSAGKKKKPEEQHPDPVMLGADVRSKLCSSMRVPLKRGWTTAWVLGRDGKSLEARFIDPARNAVTEDIPIDAEEWQEVLTRGATGIEFRAIDNFPSEGLEAFARTVVLVAAAAAAWDADKASSITPEALRLHASGLSPSWKAAMRAVERGGSQATLPAPYITKLMSHLRLEPLKPQKSGGASGGAYDTLCAVVRALHARYSRHPVAVQLDPENNSASTKKKAARSGPPVMINYNELAAATAYM